MTRCLSPVRRYAAVLATVLAVLAAVGIASATLTACTPPVGVAGVEIVAGYRVDPTFNAFTQPCAIRYSLDQPALVQIRIVRVREDGQRELVLQLTGEQRETAGPRTAAWRGTGANGLFAPQGQYEVELFARLDGSDRTEQWSLPTVMFRS